MQVVSPTRPPHARRSGTTHGPWTHVLQTSHELSFAIMAFLDGRVQGGDAGLFFSAAYGVFDDAFQRRTLVRRYDAAVHHLFGDNERNVPFLRGAARIWLACGCLNHSADESARALAALRLRSDCDPSVLHDRVLRRRVEVVLWHPWGLRYCLLQHRSSR